MNGINKNHELSLLEGSQPCQYTTHLHSDLYYSKQQHNKTKTKTKTKTKKEKKTLLWMKSCIVFIGFFQRIASLIYSKIEMHKDKIVDKN